MDTFYQVCTVCRQSLFVAINGAICCEQCAKMVKKEEPKKIDGYNRCTVCRKQWVWQEHVCIDCLEVGKVVS